MDKFAAHYINLVESALERRGFQLEKTAGPVDMVARAVLPHIARGSNAMIRKLAPSVGNKISDAAFAIVSRMGRFAPKSLHKVVLANPTAVGRKVVGAPSRMIRKGFNNFAKDPYGAIGRFTGGLGLSVGAEALIPTADPSTTTGKALNLARSGLTWGLWGLPYGRKRFLSDAGLGVALSPLSPENFSTTAYNNMRKEEAEQAAAMEQPQAQEPQV